MRSFWKIVVGIFAWVVLMAYFVWALDLTHRKATSVAVKGVDVAVSDSARQSIVTCAKLNEWIQESGVELRNADTHQIDTEKIRLTIASKPFVKGVTVYTTISGELVVRATQRYPICRVVLENGYDFLLSEDGYVLPSEHGTGLHLPIITGLFNPPFDIEYVGLMAECEKNVEKNYLFLSKLINFVKFIESDEFWSNQIVQINVLPQSPEEIACAWREPNIELVPRAGNFIVLFGELTDVAPKFEKLMLMYDNVIGFEGWQGFKTINLRYANQVVCSNRQAAVEMND